MIKSSLPFIPAGLVDHVQPKPDRLIIIPVRIPPPAPVQHAVTPSRDCTGTTPTPSPTCPGRGCLYASQSGLGAGAGAFQSAAALTTAFIGRLPNAAMFWERRTHRLGGLQYHLRLALREGSEAWQLKRSSIRTSGDMLLRLPRHGSTDQSRCHAVDLQVDREAATLASWVDHHPGAEILTRDRRTALPRIGTPLTPSKSQIASSCPAAGSSHRIR